LTAITFKARRAISAQLKVGGSVIVAKPGFAADIVWRGLGPVVPEILRRISGAYRVGL